MNLLIAGGAGFIGSNFCHLLAGRGHHGVVLDALTYAGSEKNVQDIPPTALRFVHGDIRDQACIDNVLRKGFGGERFDAVVNFAAESHVDRSISDAMPFVSTNVMGAVVSLEAARRHEVPIFLQVSTDEVYGSIGGTEKFTTHSPLEPSSGYSASKAAADLLLRAFHKTHRYDVRVTRCTNNYGPYQHSEKFIPTVISCALAGRDIPIYGDGLQVRDWIYVDDHCHGIFDVLEHGVAGGIYHFGGPVSEEITNLELVEAVFSIIASETGRALSDLRRCVVHVGDRPGHDRRYALDWSDSERELSWRPSVALTEGLERTVRWYLKNA
jgi:dTDP-glucose 4,6-dehydratase